MRPSKLPAAQARSSPEKCGVWLDTADLRRRKPVRSPRPISMLLNPLSRYSSYSVSVALSFTQTKTQFPATRQSSITSFLSPQHHVEEAPSPGPDQRSATPPLATGRKRKRVGEASRGGGDGETRPLPEDSSVRGCCSPPRPLSCQSEEWEEPVGKRRAGRGWMPESESLRWSFTQDSEGNRVLAHRDLQPTFSQGRQGKENQQPQQRPPRSPLSQRPPRSPLSQRPPRSPLSQRPPRSPLSQRPPRSPLSQRPPRSPLSQCPLQAEADSHALLFTQDSQGQQVIAHRTPLQDHSNWASSSRAGWTVPSVAVLEGGDSDSELGRDVLFTQDSEGNMVIKH
ncbi:aurora kinase A and ninein-interacting protein [Megalops cyprinoides]|uniref:aurora kinase A and ninein-interacting protein n=1 Tax=Megalops cyprinoides TaxID=118141 RepID=UPI0018651E7F|nr:aurora kinase A and ninein-interacting protein [Megalops cyprinoides]